MSFSFATKAVAVRTARWSAVPALAAATIALAASPALANASSARVSANTASVSHGQVTVGGTYQCAGRGSDQLRVTVVGENRRNQVEASRTVNVSCAAWTHTWRLTLNSDRRNEQFTAGQVRVQATLVNPRNRNDHASTSRTLFAR
ncbi:DUF6299 family protein [Actinospica robiniae]|uniref:DUF6299 family protein n=1 Tax=Actinospica robiniae TaxID=304901 RepID=UPI00040D0FB4|nr:DUF6299 family protein [Actinospica robiniae]